MPWLPPDFTPPTIAPVLQSCHLRPVRAADADIDHRAVMGSRDRLWRIYGEVWDWPAETMTVEQDRADLSRHERAIEARESFVYAVLNTAESELFGRVHVDPPRRTGADAEVTWWVVDDRVGTIMETALDVLVPRWITGVWPFDDPRYPGRDLTWQEWLALPDA
jgi:hypothetical protein